MILRRQLEDNAATRPAALRRAIEVSEAVLKQASIGIRTVGASGKAVQDRFGTSGIHFEYRPAAGR